MKTNQESGQASEVRIQEWTINALNQVIEKANGYNLGAVQGWHPCASARHRPFIFSLDAQVST